MNQVKGVKYAVTKGRRLLVLSTQLTAQRPNYDAAPKTYVTNQCYLNTFNF